jgi:hypothetical protein
MTTPTKSLVPTPSTALSLATPHSPLVVVPTLNSVPPPSLEERAIVIRRAHDDIASAIHNIVERALEAGLQLLAAKDEVGHGRFETYVVRCGMKMRTAQNYMKLARQEIKLRELLSERSAGNAHLTMDEAMREVAKLDAKKKPKRRKSAGMLAIFRR